MPRFLHPEHDSQLELSLDDVFLVPSLYEGASRTAVSLAPDDFPGGTHPIVAANMNSVAGKRMCETLARLGGLGVLPQDMAPETVARIVAFIKAADIRFDTPLTVGPSACLRDVAGIIHKRSHGLVVVVDDGKRVLGVVTPADLHGKDQYSLVSDVMVTRCVTITRETSNRDAFLLMEAARVKAAPCVDTDGRLIGVLTRAEAVRYDLLRPSLDKNGRLMVAAAIGVSSPGASADTAERLVKSGVDVLVLDTAHGHQRRMLDCLRAVRARLTEKDLLVPLVAGNVCTAQATIDLIEAGADVLKVNVGPGAQCTTRMQTGVGRPSFSSVAACAEAARARGKHVWADGGVRYPRDVALYLAAGASRVMIGTWFAGTYEAPGDAIEDSNGQLYKVCYGMASQKAVEDRTSKLDAFERAKRAVFREGISQSKIYLKQGQESVGDIVMDVTSGVMSSFTYCGASSLAEFQANAVVGVQTAGGFHEGTPHALGRK